MRFQGNGKLRGALFVPAYPVVFQLSLNGAFILKVRQQLETIWLTNQFDIYWLIVEILNNQGMVVIDKMVDDGIEEIVAIPLFISEGDHLKNDIPPKIHLTDGIREGTFKQNGREITVKYCFPIGSDYRLTQLIAAKIRKYDY